jgi:hypothetical protein
MEAMVTTRTLEPSLECASMRRLYYTQCPGKNGNHPSSFGLHVHGQISQNVCQAEQNLGHNLSEICGI